MLVKAQRPNEARCHYFRSLIRYVQVWGTTLNDLGFKYDVGPHLVERYVRHVLSGPFGLPRNLLGYTANE
jgi:hypothetical protein